MVSGQPKRNDSNASIMRHAIAIIVKPCLASGIRPSSEALPEHTPYAPLTPYVRARLRRVRRTIILMTPIANGTQCTAHSRSGAQCRSRAITGATVCRMHGGAAPHVREAARRRLALALDPTAKRLVGLINDRSLEERPDAGCRIGLIKQIPGVGAARRARCRSWPSAIARSPASPKRHRR